MKSFIVALALGAAAVLHASQQQAKPPEPTNSMAAPMRLDAPVTTATLPESFSEVVFISFGFFDG
jgi:hypothetical protein